MVLNQKVGIRGMEGRYTYVSDIVVFALYSTEGGEVSWIPTKRKERQFPTPVQQPK